jgi:myo-inositol-hexaphosphate 3-phosphohydrolase
VTDTDGIETINYNLNEEYPEGIMIAQDGLNKDGYRTKRQNFKIVSFKDVLDALDVIR